MCKHLIARHQLKWCYYSFKIFPRFWLAKSTCIIHHKGLVIIYQEAGGWCNVKYAMLDFCWLDFSLTWFLLTPPAPPHPPLSSGMHETKSMYLSSYQVQLIDILFKATLNLDSSCSSPRLCVDNCRIDIKVLGALNHFFFFSWLLFSFRAWNTNLCKDTVFFLWVVFWFTTEWIRRGLIVALPILLSLNALSKFLDDIFFDCFQLCLFCSIFSKVMVCYVPS